LPTLDPEHLTVLVFGPGVGELVLVRAPPGEWMVIDGCEVAEVGYGQRVLTHYEVRPAVIALTHPHDDHSMGLLKVIDAATPYENKLIWPRIGMVLPCDVGSTGNLQVVEKLYVGGVTERVIGAVEARWHDHPPCRWDMNRGDEIPLGDARVRVLSPEPARRRKELEKWRKGRLFQKNPLSTALEIVWGERRVVLGSDLVERPGRGWSHSLAFEPEIPDHDLLKIPHHGSVEALHDGLLASGARVPGPLRVIVPYNRSDLPSFAPGGGIDRILGRGGTTYATGLPRPHDRQSGQLEARSIAELRAHDTLMFTPPTPGFPDCYVAVSLPPGGGPPHIERGVGSVRVL
jgi:beta-lactamase superfamily II metal-dependent hydrolase